MDPDLNLARIRELLAEINDCSDRDTVFDLMCDLTDRVEALDCWIAGGGFLPADWSKNATRESR